MVNRPNSDSVAPASAVASALTRTGTPDASAEAPPTPTFSMPPMRSYRSALTLLPGSRISVPAATVPVSLIVTSAEIVLMPPVCNR